MPEFQVGLRMVGQRGGLFNDQQFRRDVQKTNQKFAKRMKRSFERTTRTWAEHQPVFRQETRSDPPSCMVYTDDEIYAYVSEGTSVRFATMTDDFVAKTRPGELDARPGSGSLAYVSLNNPREGIEARNFPEQVEQLHAPEYAKEIEDDLDRAIARAEQ